MFHLSISFYLFLHVSFINIALSLFTCFTPAYSKEVYTGKNYMYPRVLSLYETVISICALLFDPNGGAIMTQTGPMSSTQTWSNIFVCCSNCIPNRHAHLSIYLVISKQSVLLRFQYLSHIHEQLLLSCMHEILTIHYSHLHKEYFHKSLIVI